MAGMLRKLMASGIAAKVVQDDPEDTYRVSPRTRVA